MRSTVETRPWMTATWAASSTNRQGNDGPEVEQRPRDRSHGYAVDRSDVERFHRVRSVDGGATQQREAGSGEGYLGTRSGNLAELVEPCGAAVGGNGA